MAESRSLPIRGTVVSGLFRVNADGSSQRRLTPAMGHDANPDISWSPVALGS